MSTFDVNFIKDCFLDFARDRGLSAQEKPDGKVSFSMRGVDMVFVADGSDSSLFKIVVMNVAHIAQYGDDAELFVNHLNTKFKLVKTFILRGMICMSIDQLVYSPMFIDRLFARAVRTMVEVVSFCREHKVVNVLEM